jgi:hypothetical protein
MINRHNRILNSEILNNEMLREAAESLGIAFGDVLDVDDKAMCVF